MLILSRLEVRGVIAGTYKSRGKSYCTFVVERHRDIVQAPLSVVFSTLSYHVLYWCGTVAKPEVKLPASAHQGERVSPGGIPPADDCSPTLKIHSLNFG